MKMEQWQRLVVKQNLPELVDLTSCNMELLTRLFSRDILTQEEINEIDVTKNRKRKAYKLYELIVTRKNAYHLFISTCKETRQTGVVSILEDGESSHRLLKEGECKVIHPNPVTEKSAFGPTLGKSPLLKTSSTKAEESLSISNFALDLSGYKQHDFIETPNISSFKSSCKALPASTISRVDKIPEVNDKQSSITKGEIQFFDKLSQIPQQKIIDSLEKCRIENPNAKFVPVFDANAKKNSDKQLGLKTKESNENGDFFKVDSLKNINEADNDGRTILHRALAEGENLNVIKILIDNNADYELKDKSKEGVLHFAVRGGNKDVISFLMSFKLDINQVDVLGETPLLKVHFTKSRNLLGLTKTLLRNGADLSVKDKNENTVAHLLAIHQNISFFDFVIWVEGMINIGQGHIFAVRGEYGRTPLQSVMQRLDLDLTTLKLILESSKVDINQQDNNDATLLHLALHFERSLKTIENLISLGANIKIMNKRGSGVLHLAVIVGNKEVIQYLISRGLDANEQNSIGNTPLHTVRETRTKNYVELTKLLVDNGADLYSKNILSNTLAHEMVIWEDVSCNDFKIWVTAMIQNGHAHLFTIRGNWGRTLLHASMDRLDLDLETIKLIIESAKLDINQPDDRGDNILHLALEFGRSLGTIKSLVDLGGDWKRKGRDDCSVLHCAVVGSNKEAFSGFKSLGVDVNAKDKNGRTALHYVAWARSKDYFGMTKFLLENGANLNVKDNSGRTLDHYMTSCDWISAEEYGLWKEGMIKMGHVEFFHQ